MGNRKPIVHRITPDSEKSPVLARELGSLRAGMVQAANRHPLPAGFTANPCEDSPAFVLTHEATGRTTQVPLFAWGAVKQALHELLGGTE